MSLSAAIAQLEAEIELMNPADPKKRPMEGSADFYLLRAKALGLSMLRRQAQLKFASPAATERHYRACRKQLAFEEQEGIV